MADLESDEELLLGWLLKRRQRKKDRTTLIWVHNISRQRLRLGEFYTSLRELTSYEDTFVSMLEFRENHFREI